MLAVRLFTKGRPAWGRRQLDQLAVELEEVGRDCQRAGWSSFADRAQVLVDRLKAADRRDDQVLDAVLRLLARMARYAP